MTCRHPGYAAVRAQGAALAAVLLGLLAVVGLPAVPADAAAAKYVGIVIAGKGSSCVRWHSGITGDAVLNAVASVAYRNDGLIVAIDGSPSPAKADATHYWSYWHDTGGSWTYSSSGASGYQPKAGSVEGWSFDNGGKKAAPPGAAAGGLYASLCGAKDAPKATAPHRTSTRSSPARSTATRATSRPAPSARPAATGTGRIAQVPAGQTADASALPSTTSAAAGGTKPGATPTPGRSTAASGSAAADPVPSLAHASSVAEKSSSASSPWPALLGVALVLLLGAGGGWGVLRRRRAETADQ